jgi:putative NIF3 family GTP cyclohydrolase 1 type 2
VQLTRPKDILQFVECKTGHQIHPDEDITFGARTANLTGVTVAWTVNPDTIAAAAAKGHNCIVHHEALTYPYPAFTSGKERHYLSWPINVQRLSLLARHDMTSIRLHGSLDELYIFDAFARQLRLQEHVDGNESNEYPPQRIYSSPVDTFGELVEHVKATMGMSALRTTLHERDRPVERIGLPWGGVGLFVNVNYAQSLFDLGVDTLICGETDNYGFRFADELGIAVIETSHEVSEEEGLREFAEELRDALNIDVRPAHTECVWRVR